MLTTNEQATKELYDNIRQSITDTFTGKDGDHSWSVDLHLRVVKSAKDIKEKDHVFQLLSTTPMSTDGTMEVGRASVGGTVVNVSEAAFAFNRKAPGHEFGHSAGLRHPFGPEMGAGVDSDNPISSDTSATPMSYSKNTGGFTSKQVQLSQFYATQGDLNGSHYIRELGKNGMFTEKWADQNRDLSSVFGRKRFGGEFQGQRN